MSPLARNLISRATALCVGLALCYACWRVVGGIQAATRDAEEQRARLGPRGGRVVGPLPLQWLLLVATGVPGVIFTGFAILPTRVLHALPIGPPRDPRDDVDTITSIGRWR